MSPEMIQVPQFHSLLLASGMLAEDELVSFFVLQIFQMLAVKGSFVTEGRQYGNEAGLLPLVSDLGL
jgi:hypothetical protein